MLVKLRTLRDRLLGTLWFVPTGLVASSLVLAVGMVELSSNVDSEALARWPRLFGASADSSRSILAAVASGMITVAGLTFSLTMVAVTQASSQYTSRILRTFMGDRANQLVLGTFVGIFVYCLVVLRTVRSVEERVFVPSLAVVLGIVLAIVGIGVLIYAVHHFASMLQASSIVARVAQDTLAAVDRLFPASLGVEADAPHESAALHLARVAAWYPVLAPATGYVQALDEDGLVAQADDAGRLVRMDRGLGDFVVEDTPLAAIAVLGDQAADDDALDALGDRLAATFTIGRYRTVEQDAAFGVRQLVDVALKALSPGVNDTTTAVSCVDYLGAILLRLVGRRVESPVRECNGVARVIARGPTFESLLRLSFDEIRQSASGNVSVLRRLFDTVTDVAAAVSNASRRALLAEQAGLVHELAERTVPAAYDKEQLRAGYRRAMLACAGVRQPGHSPMVRGAP